MIESLNIRAEWDSEKTAWIATCELWEKSSIEAGSIDELIEMIKPLIPELTLAGKANVSGEKYTIRLIKYWPVTSYISI